MYGYVYKTTNLINGRIYIGQHKSNGWDEHYIGSGKILEIAFKKYGRKNFVCEIIESCKTKEEINQKEIYWIAFYREKNKCYNITNGGEGRAAPHSEETRHKIGEANKIANKKLCKRIEQICYKTQEVVAQYDSIAEAEKQTGINRAYISQLCHGKGKQCFGYTWRFITRPPQSYMFVEEIEASKEKQ